MASIVQTLGLRQIPEATPPPLPQASGLRVLAITADVRFFSTLLYLGTGCGWQIEWARSLSHALRVLESTPFPVAVYDSNIVWQNWPEAVQRLSSLPDPPKVLLASPEVTQELWMKVLRCHGYDVIPRSAQREELMRAFHFASLAHE